jgi:hypothetical protein
MTNGNDFAFNDSATRLKSATENGIEAHNPPITKREYFAAMALQGLMACEYKGTEKQFAKKSVGMADALINALNNQ